MEFRLKLTKDMDKSWNFKKKATYLSPSCVFFGHGILLCGHGKVIEKSWNFVAEIRGNPVGICFGKRNTGCGI